MWNCTRFEMVLMQFTLFISPKYEFEEKISYSEDSYILAGENLKEDPRYNFNNLPTKGQCGEKSREKLTLQNKIVLFLQKI